MNFFKNRHFASILRIIHIKRSISQGFWGVKYKANYIAKYYLKTGGGVIY